MTKSNKFESQIQSVFDWYMAPIRLVERLFWCIEKTKEQKVPWQWQIDRKVFWYLSRISKSIFVLLYLPIVAIWYVLYVFSWFWPLLFGGVFNALLEKIST
jgi:hypothetical protein